MPTLTAIPDINSTFGKDADNKPFPVAILVGALAGSFALFCILFYFLYRRRKNASFKDEEQHYQSTAPSYTKKQLKEFKTAEKIYRKQMSPSMQFPTFADNTRSDWELPAHKSQKTKTRQMHLDPPQEAKFWKQLEQNRFGEANPNTHVRTQLPPYQHQHQHHYQQEQPQMETQQAAWHAANSKFAPAREVPVPAAVYQSQYRQ